MKKHSLLLLLLTLPALPAWAGTITLTTWYPPPSGAYNQVKLATGNIVHSANPGFCDGTNDGKVYTDSNGTLYICTAGVGVKYCAAGTKGTLVADNTGTLHACIYNSTTATYQDLIYPQQCYNAYCSYDTTVVGTPCALPTINPPPCYPITTPSNAICAQGFSPTAVDSSSNSYDTFPVSTHTCVVSFACCTQSVS